MILYSFLKNKLHRIVLIFKRDGTVLLISMKINTSIIENQYVIHLKMHIMGILFMWHDLRQQVVYKWLKLWFETDNWHPNQLQAV